MTGPAVPSDEELQSELGRVLAEHQTILYGVDHRARCSCGWVGDTSSWAPTLHRRDVLLPVIRRYADQRAAEELRAAAKNVSWPTVNATFFRRVLRGRADALTREATT